VVGFGPSTTGFVEPRTNEVSDGRTSQEEELEGLPLPARQPSHLHPRSRSRLGLQGHQLGQETPRARPAPELRQVRLPVREGDVRLKERADRRVERVLARLKLKRVEQLARFSESQLLAVPRVGRTTLRDIERRLRKHGLSFKSIPIGTPMPQSIRDSWTEHRDTQLRIERLRGSSKSTPSPKPSPTSAGAGT
jgi:hypothetical protein